MFQGAVKKEFENIRLCRQLARKKNNGDESQIYNIGAMIKGKEPEGVFTIGTRNSRLEVVHDLSDAQGYLGGASNMIHAETAAIMRAPATEGADLYVTDPLCPNCMKNAIEAGVKRIFLDKAGFDKPWYKRRKDFFDNISALLAHKAGIDIYIVDVEHEKLEHLGIPYAHKAPKSQYPVKIIPLDSATPAKKMDRHIELLSKEYEDIPFATVTGRDRRGRLVLVAAAEAYTPGISEDQKELFQRLRRNNTDTKYNLKCDPVTRLLMAASRNGISLRGSQMYCTELPSSRCLINSVAYGMQDLKIKPPKETGGRSKPPVAADLHAARVLHGNGIFNITYTDGRDIFPASSQDDNHHTTQGLRDGQPGL